MTPIVLVPGLLCTAEVFAPQLAALWPHGAVTVASTLEGETMAAMAASILRNAPPRFALGGISMGGYIAFEILRQAPDRVTKLALLDTTARPDTPEATTDRRALVQRVRAGEDFLSVVTPNLDLMLHPAHVHDVALRAVLSRMAMAVAADGFARQEEAIIGRIDSRPSLPRIAVPTTMLVGDTDNLTPVERAEEIARAIPHARLVVIEESGHASTLEQPEAVNRALVEWIVG